MSHFYGTLQGNCGQVTRQGTKRTGLSAVAASWADCVKVYVYINQQGRDCFTVYQEPWQGAGIREDLAQGILGQPALSDAEPQIENPLERGYHSNRYHT